MRILGREKFRRFPVSPPPRVLADPNLQVFPSNVQIQVTNHVDIHRRKRLLNAGVTLGSRPAVLDLSQVQLRRRFGMGDEAFDYFRHGCRTLDRAS